MRMEQRPIGSPFGARTTAAEAVGGADLAGQVAVVTGGYSGIGLETTRVLAGAGATVVVPARSRAKADAALAGIAGVVVEDMDLLDPASVEAFAQRALRRHPAIRILVNSAGVMATPLARDRRGYEAQFAGNHLGHFQLAAALWPALAAEGARVVSVSSRAHRLSGVDFEDPNFLHRAYDRWQAYGQSKTANALFAVELDRRGAAHGIRAFSVHPGTIVTELSRHLTAEDRAAFGLEARPDGSVDVDRFLSRGGDAKTPAQGAATSVWCAVSPLLDGRGGVYCEDCDIAEAVAAESPGANGVRPWARDPVAAARLWALSEELLRSG